MSESSKVILTFESVLESADETFRNRFSLDLIFSILQNSLLRRRYSGRHATLIHTRGKERRVTTLITAAKETMYKNEIRKFCWISTLATSQSERFKIQRKETVLLVKKVPYNPVVHYRFQWVRAGSQSSCLRASSPWAPGGTGVGRWEWKESLHSRLINLNICVPKWLQNADWLISIFAPPPERLGERTVWETGQ